MSRMMLAMGTSRAARAWKWDRRPMMAGRADLAMAGAEADFVVVVAARLGSIG